MVIAYDGTEFLGWQIQAQGKTVQGEIEAKLSTLFNNQKITLIGAGRTDSGVHALGQVANIKLDINWDAETMKNALNANLGDDIWIKDVSEEGPDFHARFSAKSRKYEYHINTEYSPIKRNYEWWIMQDLDFDILQQCAKMIKNTTDFTRFCKSTAEVNNYLCKIIESHWEINETMLVYTVKANRFLQHMVRFLVGTMIEVARGRVLQSEFQNMLDDKEGKISVFRAPAKGLILTEVAY